MAIHLSSFYLNPVEEEYPFPEYVHTRTYVFLRVLRFYRISKERLLQLDADVNRWEFDVFSYSVDDLLGIVLIILTRNNILNLFPIDEGR